MEPKDLGNSKEVNETKKSNLKKEEKKSDSGKKKPDKLTVETADEKKVKSDPKKKEATETKKKTVSDKSKKVKDEPEASKKKTQVDSAEVEKTVKKKNANKELEQDSVEKPDKQSDKQKSEIKDVGVTSDDKNKKEIKTDSGKEPEQDLIEEETKSSEVGEIPSNEENKKVTSSLKDKEQKAEKKEESLQKDKPSGKTETSANNEKIQEKNTETESPAAEKKSSIQKEKKATIVKPEEKPLPDKDKKKKEEKNDYSNYTAVELVNALRDILDNPDDHDLKAEIDDVKSAFYKQKNEQIELAKKEFIDGGGMEEEFVEEDDPYEQDIKDLLKRYRQIRIEYNKKLEVEKEENLQKKYEVIENIKNLINAEESINKTFNEFRELQREWREIGLVPQSKMKNLWDLYHFHVENFYDYIKINRELRDLDLKKNLEMKINLCENAEELLVEPSIIKAFNTLQKYHEQWREIGPVPRENKDDIWERFKTITAKINKKHQEFFENRKGEQKKNLEAKTALCEKVEEICEQEIDSFREWDEKSKEVIELQKVWRTIGFAPKKDNNKIYERFRTACDGFFNRKRDFYSKNKEEQQNNLQLKIELCELAESLKESSDWKKTTNELIYIQKQWKEIGPVPRKQSDAIWKRFRAACDYFFDKKSEHFSEIDSEQVDNLKLKEDLIKEVEKFKSTGDVEKNLKTLKEFQRRWTEIGHVPYKKKDDMQNRFRQAVNKLYDDLNIDDERRNILKFKNKMASFSETNRGQNKMRLEREKYINKLKQLENDLVLLDNNIGFFAKSKNAETLIKDVKKKIEITKQKIETLKEKIRVIDELENQ